MTDKKGLTLDQLERTVADQIIALMERDGLRWIKGWASPLPAQNFYSRRPYTGSNVLTTGLWMMVSGKSDPRFMSFKQAVMLGGSVKKGAKGIPIIYYGTYVKDDDGAERMSRFAKISYVFHVSDVDGIEIPGLDMACHEPRVRNQRIDSFVAATGVQIRDGGSAFYQDTTDSITIPPIGMFRESLGVPAEDLYYSVLLHELIHATGPAKRLARECFRDYHKERAARAQEELIAEIGSVMLGQRLGLMTQPREDNAAYVASWIRFLKDKPGSVFSAAAAASKAISCLEAMQPLTEQEAA
ncbi:ArdC family protein [Tabrizicola sp. BL-A-41-H6]|uniref:ArdC family protein n=1 Tax=Tabrizicola sp. BL-A-41-H6 TaxID=3421107 RepID=UPI003D67D9D7